MENVFRIIESSISIPSTVTVLRQEEYSQLREATTIIERAKQQAKEIIEQAEEEKATYCQRGYQEGLEQGKAEHTEKIMDTVLEAVDFIESLENAVVKTVVEAMHKVLGDMNVEERIVAVVSHALSYVRNQAKVTIRVADHEAYAVQQALQSSMGTAYNIQIIDVVGDHRLAPGSCLLESALGIVDASVETQLKGLERAIESRFRER